LRSLAIHNRNQVHNLDGLRYSYGGAMRVFKAMGNRPAAITFAKLAVNTQQKVRIQNRGLKKELAKSLAEDWRSIYQFLADLLIEEGRLSEAQYVLELLKDYELFDFVRRDESIRGEKIKLIPLSKGEQALIDKVNALQAEPIALGKQAEKLRSKKSLTDKEKAQLADLDKAMDIAYDTYLAAAKAVLDKAAKEKWTSPEEVESF
jgi:hypothetical protein